MRVMARVCARAASAAARAQSIFDLSPLCASRNPAPEQLLLDDVVKMSVPSLFKRHRDLWRRARAAERAALPGEERSVDGSKKRKQGPRAARRRTNVEILMRKQPSWDAEKHPRTRENDHSARPPEGARAGEKKRQGSGRRIKGVREARFLRPLDASRARRRGWRVPFAMK